MQRCGKDDALVGIRLGMSRVCVCDGAAMVRVREDWGLVAAGFIGFSIICDEVEEALNMKRIEKWEVGCDQCRDRMLCVSVWRGWNGWMWFVLDEW